MTPEAKKERNLFLIIKQAVIDIYNHLGYSILVSFLWFLTFIPFAVFVLNVLNVFLDNQDHPLSLFLFLLIFGVPYAAFILGPVQTTLYYQMHQVINNDAELKGLWVGLRKHYWQSAGVYALYAGMLIFCLVDLIICLVTPGYFWLKALGIFLLYLLTFLVLGGLYLPGFIVLQNNTLKAVYKKSFVLVLDNIFISIGALLILLLMGIAFTLITPLLAAFFGSCLQVVLIRLFRGVLMKYPDPVEVTREESSRQ